MKKFKLYSLVLVLFLTAKIQAQVQTDSSKTFTNIEEALKNPDEVISLDLSNQTINLSDSAWKRFGNLEFLSLKDEHLKEVPHGLVYLNKLKILDLSGNDIKELPSFMGKMKNLEEVYLNDETNLDVNQSIAVLAKLPKLKTLHMENDHLANIPSKIFKLKNLENLYLNNNEIKSIPVSIRLPKSLKRIDLKMNEIGKMIDKENRFGKGLIIDF